MAAGLAGGDTADKYAVIDKELSVSKEQHDDTEIEQDVYAAWTRLPGGDHCCEGQCTGIAGASKYR